MDKLTKFRLINALVLLNERRVEDCRDFLLEVVEEDSSSYLKALLQLVEILSFIKERQNFDFDKEVENLFKIMDEIEEDDIGLKFKEMIFQIVEFLNYPTSKRRIFINWQIIF
jgi:hypothetical protein